MATAVNVKLRAGLFGQDIKKVGVRRLFPGVGLDSEIIWWNFRANSWDGVVKQEDRTDNR